MPPNKLLVEAEAVATGLEHMADSIVARDTDCSDLAIVGIRRGGEPVAKRLVALLEKRIGHAPDVGSLDITLYRDDAATALPSPRIGPSHIPFDVRGRRVVLVDDVLYTGRTIRAAVDALLDYGRPRRIELAVIADRGGRELPIQPDYCVARLEVPETARVEVEPGDLSVREHVAVTTADPGDGGDA
jgi:pyrimidine operon attenuation protein/uracil phosphoribosyltransferase